MPNTQPVVPVSRTTSGAIGASDAAKDAAFTDPSGSASAAPIDTSGGSLKVNELGSSALYTPQAQFTQHVVDTSSTANAETDQAQCEPRDSQERWRLCTTASQHAPTIAPLMREAIQQQDFQQAAAIYCYVRTPTDGMHTQMQELLVTISDLQPEFTPTPLVNAALRAYNALLRHTRNIGNIVPQVLHSMIIIYGRALKWEDVYSHYWQLERNAPDQITAATYTTVFQAAVSRLQKAPSGLAVYSALVKMYSNACQAQKTDTQTHHYMMTAALQTQQNVDVLQAIYKKADSLTQLNAQTVYLFNCARQQARDVCQMSSSACNYARTPSHREMDMRYVWQIRHAQQSQSLDAELQNVIRVYTTAYQREDINQQTDHVMIEWITQRQKTVASAIMESALTSFWDAAAFAHLYSQISSVGVKMLIWQAFLARDANNTSSTASSANSAAPGTDAAAEIPTPPGDDGLIGRTTTQHGRNSRQKPSVFSRLSASTPTLSPICIEDTRFHIRAS